MAQKIEWVRKLDSTYVYPATAMFLKRNDLFACDIKGRLLSGGEEDLPEPIVQKPAVSPHDDTESEDENSKLVKLREQAVKLGIKKTHLMKESTLIARITEKEAEIAKTAK